MVAYKYMGGVDLSDCKIYHVSAERPSKRFWKKIFFNLVDTALLNSYILYQANTDGGQTLMRHDYIVAVVESLCLGDGEVLGVPAPPLFVAGLLPHDLQRLPGKRERECVVCSDRSAGIRKRSSYYCTGCNLGIQWQCMDHLRQRSQKNQFFCTMNLHCVFMYTHAYIIYGYSVNLQFLT